MAAHRPAQPPVVPTSGRWVVEQAFDGGVELVGTRNPRELRSWELTLRHRDTGHIEPGVRTMSLPTTTYRVGDEVEGEVRPRLYGSGNEFRRAPSRVRERRA